MTFKPGDRVHNTRTYEVGTVVESYHGRPLNPSAGAVPVIWDEDPNVWMTATCRLEIVEDENGHGDYEPPCSCRLAPVHSTGIDPPGMILDHYCPVHGDGGPDPDAQRDDWMKAACEDEDYANNQ